MQPAAPSRTALRVALRRAAHQLVDAEPLVFPDPFAIPILGPHAAELDRTPRRADRPHSIALRAWIVARSRFAEDTLARAVLARGVTQLLLLGAGLDTFSLRNPHPGLRIFEVDHPATHLWKQNLLTTLSLHPAHTTFVPMDFEQQDLFSELLRSGFDPAFPAQVSWLGVVPYLSLAAFRSTLTFLTALAPGSGVVLDYGQPRHLLPPLEQLAHDSLAARVAQAGEPFQLFLSLADMRHELRAFSQVQDLGRDDLNALYFSRRRDSLRLLGSAGRLLSAIL